MKFVMKLSLNKPHRRYVTTDTTRKNKWKKVTTGRLVIKKNNISAVYTNYYKKKNIMVNTVKIAVLKNVSLWST